MSESRGMFSSLRRVVLPLLVAIVLVVGTILVSGSHFIQAEDVTLGRILAGTYGTPDWRVQEMNPLLAQLLTLLQRVLPSVNWFGVMLLALLAVAAAAGISLAARKKGGLIPAIIVVSPIVVLLTNSMISTAVCAFCAVVGTLSVLDGFQRKKEGIARLVIGIILFVFAAGMSLNWPLLLAVCAALCWLPYSVRESRFQGLVIGVVVLAVLAAALFGYSSLMYGSPELSSYRSNYALYEDLQHSSLKDEAARLMDAHGIFLYSEGHSEDDGHDHSAEELQQLEAQEEEVNDNIFTNTVGWSINDADLFFRRYSNDTELLNPEDLAKLNVEASHWNFDISRLGSELLTTLKKPQFLLMIGLFVVSALAVLITSRRRGLVVLMAAIIAFGGHVLMLAHYYDQFAQIVPFYLLGIGIMLFYFDGEDAKAWMQRVFKPVWLRIGLYALALVVFVGGMGGLLYYTSITPPPVDQYVKTAIDFLKPYVAEHKEMLFIGENPNDRDKPATLAVPVRGEDENLLAGSYDLYSPRRAALMAAHDIENPLRDVVDRTDMGYVLMGFPEGFVFRLSSHYGIYVKEPVDLFTYPQYAEKVMQLVAFTQEEIDAAIAQAEAEQAEADALAEMINDLIEQGLITVEDDDHEHEEGDGHDHDDETPTEPTASPAPSASPNV